jgi:hypothetical protein
MVKVNWKKYFVNTLKIIKILFSEKFSLTVIETGLNLVYLLHLAPE